VAAGPPALLSCPPRDRSTATVTQNAPRKHPVMRAVSVNSARRFDRGGTVLISAPTVATTLPTTLAACLYAGLRRGGAAGAGI
jgi:hypothetical protein